jgi:glucokinase
MANKAAQKNPESLINELAKKEGKITGKIIFDSAKQGDALAKRLVKKYTEYVSAGLVSLVNIFRPSCIIIGGGISNAGDSFFKPIQKYILQNSYGKERSPRVEVRSATLKNDAGLLGGVALAMDGLGL